MSTKNEEPPRTIHLTWDQLKALAHALRCECIQNSGAICVRPFVYGPDGIRDTTYPPYPRDFGSVDQAIASLTQTAEQLSADNRQLREDARQPRRILIILEGGLVQDVISDTPVEYLILDHDTQDAQEEDMMEVPSADPDPFNTDTVYRKYPEGAVVNPDRVARTWGAADRVPSSTETTDEHGNLQLEP